MFKLFLCLGMFMCLANGYFGKKCNIQKMPAGTSHIVMYAEEYTKSDNAHVLYYRYQDSDGICGYYFLSIINND